MLPGKRRTLSGVSPLQKKKKNQAESERHLVQ